MTGAQILEAIQCGFLTACIITVVVTLAWRR